MTLLLLLKVSITPNQYTLITETDLSQKDNKILISSTESWLQ